MTVTKRIEAIHPTPESEAAPGFEEFRSEVLKVAREADEIMEAMAWELMAYTDDPETDEVWERYRKYQEGTA